MNRITRLICARVYFFGLFASIPALHRLMGLPFRGFDRDPGIDRRHALIHTIQSLLLSLVFLIPSALIYFFAPATSQTAAIVLFLLCFLKIAVLNFWIARHFFQKPASASRFKLPLLARLAGYFSERLHPLSVSGGIESPGVTVYFRGSRPFVGFGSEINAWTLAIDTTSRLYAESASLESPQRASDLEVEDLYRAIEKKVEAVEVDGVTTRRVFFMDGDIPDEERDLRGGRYGRPSPYLPESLLKNLDKTGERGRQYLVLSVLNSARDLMVSQFIRFSRSGKFIFCEFASHVMPPGKARFYTFDILFQYHPALYALMGPLVFFAIGLLATLTAPFTESWFWLGPGVGPTYLEMLSAEGYVEYVVEQMLGGWFAYRIAGFSIFLLTAFVIWRGMLWLSNVVGIFLRLRHNFGIDVSCRERWASGTRLSYFELQETVRALKIQEKIITGGLIDCLEKHEIGTSDLKQSITAFINQGVINSGEIRGNVSNKVAAIVFRRERKRRWRRGLHPLTAP